LTRICPQKLSGCLIEYSRAGAILTPRESNKPMI
jgi:hypothetical protein